MVQPTPAAPGAALSRIREVTAGAHQSLEGAIDLMDAGLPRYRELIADFFGFYEPLELSAACYREPGWLDDVDRRKTPLLRADLVSLGLSESEVASLPRCHDLPTIADAAQQLGCMYVIEGSTLGGQHISRRLLPQLGLSATHGGRFFSSYGPKVGVHWRALLNQLESRLNTPALRDTAAYAAMDTFERLQHWLTRRAQPVTVNNG